MGAASSCLSLCRMPIMATRVQAVAGMLVLLGTVAFLMLIVNEEGGMGAADISVESIVAAKGDAQAAHELQAASKEFVPVVNSLAKAHEMCRKAKKNVAKKFATRSKAARDRALAAALALCKRMKGAVQNLVVSDVAAVAGKHAASEVAHSESSADQEKALIRQDIGHMRLTGHGAHKMAKDESIARAMRRQGKKNIAKMNVKVRAACQNAKDKLKTIPRGKRYNKGKVVVRRFCAKMRRAVAQQEAINERKVRLVASGPGFITSSIAASEKIHEMHSAEAACKNAIVKAGTMPDPIKRLLARKLALKFCNHVKAIVEKEAVANKKLQMMLAVEPAV